MLHDKPNSGGGSLTVQVNFDAGANAILVDEPNEAPSPGSTDIKWFWYDCCNDGGVFDASALETNSGGEGNCLTVQYTSVNGINALYTLAGGTPVKLSDDPSIQLRWCGNTE